MRKANPVIDGALLGLMVGVTLTAGGCCAAYYDRLVKCNPTGSGSHSDQSSKTCDFIGLRERTRNPFQSREAEKHGSGRYGGLLDPRCLGWDLLFLIGIDKGAKDKLVAACKKDLKSIPVRKKILACARKLGCKAFMECVKQAYVAVQRWHLEKALKTGEWEFEALFGCINPDTKEALKPLCQKALPKAYQHYANLAKRARDLPVTLSTRPSFQDMVALIEIARILDPKLEAEVNKLNLQSMVADECHRAIFDARTLLAKLTGTKPPPKLVTKSSHSEPMRKVILRLSQERANRRSPGDAPELCHRADDGLDKETGAWAKKHQKALHQHCFVALGKVLLKKHVTATSCPAGSRKLYNRLKKHGLGSKLPVALWKQVRATCDVPQGIAVGPGGLPKGSAGTQPKEFMSSASDSGPLDAASIRRVIRRHLPEITYCYVSKGVVTNPKLAGTVKVSFTITKEGAVGSVSVAMSTLKHARTEQCIMEAVKRWRFPKPEGSMPHVTYPFHFKPSDEAHH